MKKFITTILVFLLAACPAVSEITLSSQGDVWHYGFGVRDIIPDPDSPQPLYIAGYNSGVEVSDVLDYCQARAVWINAGGEGMLLIGIDCIALDSATVAAIRESLSDIENCASINVFSTHTHAGADTLGLWGPMGIDGKNDSYMAALLAAAEEAAREAAANPVPGRLYLGEKKTTNLSYDSRRPDIYDDTLYQLRFESENGTPGLRMLFYGAHAESLRGANTLLSRDFPGLMCDIVTEETGDNTIFLPSAIGGLIMTKEYRNTDTNAVENMQVTANRIADYAKAISSETELSPSLAISREVFTVPLDNPAFLLYKFLGILGTKAVKCDSATGYGVETELSVVMLDDIAIVLVPGEIFPELVYGRAFEKANPSGENPSTFMETASEMGVEKLLIIGLANDEIGYIVPPSDFLLNEDLPYIEKTMDYRGENHYEETNSVGPLCAQCVADAFNNALSDLK